MATSALESAGATGMVTGIGGAMMSGPEGSSFIAPPVFTDNIVGAWYLIPPWSPVGYGCPLPGVVGPRSSTPVGRGYLCKDPVHGYGYGICQQLQ